MAEDGTSKTTYLPQSAARLSVKGSADDNIINAISRVEYLVLEGDNVPTGDASEKWTALTGTGSWSGSIDFTESSGSSGSSEKTVYFRAVDNAGNYEKLSTSEKIQSRKVVVDAEKPVFENVTIKSEEKDASEDAGTYYVQGAYTLQGKLVETYLKSLTINGVDVTSDSQLLTRNDDGTYTFTYTVSEPAEGQDTLSIIAVDKAEQQTLKSFNIYCDKVNPTPSFNLTPLVSANDRDNNVNGTVTIKATVIDDDKVSKSRLTISKKLSETESEVIYDEDTSSPTNFTKLVPLTKFTEENGYTLPGTSTNVKLTDKTTYIIELTSYDRAGRTGKASAEVYLDESTDKPIVELSNTNVEIASFSDVSMESGHNLFNQTSNNKMLGLITDDDGIRSIRIEYAPVNADGTVTESFRELLLKGNPDTSIPSSSVVSLGTTFTLSADLKDGGTALAEGKYKIRLSVLDITDEAASHETRYEYFVGIDIGAPVITVTTNAGYQPDTFTVEGRADDAALNAIYRYELVNGVRSENPASKWIKSNDPSANTIEYNASTKLWTDNYSGVTEGGNVIYVAEDEYGQSTEVSWSYLFDNTPPTTAPGWTPTDMSEWRNDKAPKFTLPVSDQWNVSASRIYDSFAGISSVNITVDTDSPSSMAMGNVYDGISQAVVDEHGDPVLDDSGNPKLIKPYNYYNSTQVLTDGEHTVVISAGDNANNEAENLATYTLNIDTKAPVYTAFTEGGTDFVQASDSLLSSGDVENLGTDKFTLKVNVTDVNSSARNGKVSGVRTFKVYDGNSDVTSLFEISPFPAEGVYADGTYTFTLKNTNEAKAIITTGTHEFSVEALDGAENSIKKSVSVSVDVDAPVMTNLALSPYVTEESVPKYNGKVKLSGRVTDGTALKNTTSTGSVKYEIFPGDAPSGTSKLTASKDFTNTLSEDWDFEIDTTQLTQDDGEFTILVTVEDAVHNKATNASSPLNIVVSQKTDAPVIKFNNLTNAEQTEYDDSTEESKKSNLFGMGSDQIYLTVSDDDGIASAKLYLDLDPEIDASEITDETPDIKNPKDSNKPYFDISGNPTNKALEINLAQLYYESGKYKAISEGAHTLTLVVTDSKGESNYASSSVNKIYFAYDTNLPKITVVNCNNNTYSSNMWAKETFNVYIRVSDESDPENGKNLDLICEKIEQKDKSEDNYAEYTVPQNAGTETIGNWKDSRTVPEGAASKTIENTWECTTINKKQGYYQRTYKVTDKYGRSTSTTINYQVDTNNPVFDTNHIEVQGTNNKNLSSVKAVAPENAPESDCFANTWFSTKSIKILGTAGTGASTTEKTAIKEANIDKLSITVVNNPTDDPSTNVPSTTVIVNTSTNNTFDSTFDFMDGKGRTFTLVATDKAGNKSDPLSLSLNIDTIAPSSVTGVLKVTEGTTTTEIEDDSKINYKTVELDVTAIDTTSGVKKVYIGKTPGFPKDKAIKSVDLDSAVSADTGYSELIELKIGDDSDDAYLEDGTYSLYVRVEDLAGNISDGTTAVATFTVDRTPPVVTISTPESGTEIDNTWEITGTVSDNNLPSSGSLPELWVYKTGTGWKEINTAAAQGGFGSGTSSAASRTGNNWSIKLDSTKIDSASSNKTDTFLAVRITDEAGNVTVLPEGTPTTTPANNEPAYFYLTVNQDNDRPVIKFTEVTGDGSDNTSDDIEKKAYLVKYATYVKGSVTDADGNKKDKTTFKVSPAPTEILGPSDAEDSDTKYAGYSDKDYTKWKDADWSKYWTTGFTNETEGTTLTKGKVERKDSGDFTYTPANGEDGVHDLYFYFKEEGTNGKEFWTGHSNPLNRPFVVWADKEAKHDNKSVIKYETDAHPPRINFEQYKFASSEEALTTAEYTGMPSTTFVLGGTVKGYVKFRFVPADALGIKSVTAYFGDESNTVTFTKTNEKEDQSENYFWESEFLHLGDVTEYPSNQYALSITVTDNSDLYYTGQYTIRVDNTAPTYEITYPKDSLVTGSVEIRGNSTDEGGSDVESITYFLVDDDTVLPEAAPEDAESVATRAEKETELISTMEAITTQRNIGGVKAFDYVFDGKVYDDNGRSCINALFPADSESLSKYTSFTENNQYYNIPLYFLVKDTLGNKRLYTDYTVYYNPYSDRPVTNIVYPSKVNGIDPTVSGQIRLSGSAEDNTAVGKVYIQIDTDNNGEFNGTDVSYLLSKGYHVWAAEGSTALSAYGTYNEVAQTPGTLLRASYNFDADTQFWGIEANGTSSWFLNVNADQELQTSGNKKSATENVYIVSIRATSIDENKTLGAWSDPVTFNIDPDAPSIGSTISPYIAKYEKVAGVETQTGYLEYSSLTSKDFVKGVWYLETSVEHSSGISAINYTWNEEGAATGGTVDVVKNKEIVSASEATAIKNGDKPNNYKVKIRITPSTGEGTKVLSITTNDASENCKQAQKTFTVQYDNKVPSIVELKQNGEVFDNEGGNKPVLTNSNYALTLGSSVNDEKSGMDRVLFYFYRENSASTSSDTHGKDRRVYDVGLNKTDYQISTDENSPDTRTGIGISNADGTLRNGIDYKIYGADSSGNGGLPLYGKTVTLTEEREDEDTFVFEGTDAHIRRGGLIYIGGVYRLISAKSEPTIDGKKCTSVSFTPSCATNFKEAFFPYAVVVDNTKAEKITAWDADSSAIDLDDGDGILENISGVSTNRTWEAQIHSNWIPDGPVTFVMFAMDNAENVAAKKVTCSVQNNRPRLAKVFLGTDLNQNNEYTDNEFETYNIKAKTNITQEAYTLTTKDYSIYTENPYTHNWDENKVTRSSFTVKSGLIVVPEFVGGNGDINVIFDPADATTANDAHISITDTGYSEDSLIPESGKISSESQLAANLPYWLFTTELGADTAAGQTKQVAFTFWDSTEECTIGKDTQYSFLRIKDLIVKQNDSVPPVVKVNPFFWKSSTENSLYENSSLNGHIELEDDWKKTSTYTENEAKAAADKNAEYDGDPKVSGKIVIRGTVYDDVFLEKLYFRIVDTASASVFASGLTGETEAKSGTPFADNGTYYKAAEYLNGAWTSYGTDSTWSDKGWKLRISEASDDGAFFDQTGHQIFYELSLDTSKITNGAAKDIKVEFLALDRKANDSSARKVDDEDKGYVAAEYAGSYQMDVVPYIRGVKTGLSSLKKNNSSVYDRTALGHYAVSDIEDIYLYGFNLAGGDLCELIKDVEDENDPGTLVTTTLTETAVTSSMKWYTSSLTFDKVYKTTYDTASSKLGISEFSSGAVFVKVHGVESLNNLNENDSYGEAYDTKPNVGITGDKDIYANFYNRQPNGDNNNRLTDDVVLDVWGINPEAVVPISGSVSQPVMSINPVNHDVGFAFVNGALYYSMPSGSSYSYDNFIGGFDYWTSVTMTYDSLGNSYGTAAGGDINESKADQFRIMTSRWGYADRDAGGYNRATNNLRLELIGQYDYTETTNEEGKHEGFRNFDKERIKSPSLATGAATSDSTNVYLAYYDAINDEIRFKRGGIKATKADTWSSSWNSATRAPTFFGDYYGPNTDSTGASEAQDKILGDDKAYSKYRTVHNSWIAGQTTRLTSAAGATETTKVVTTSNASVYAGQYVSIAAIPNGGTNDDAVIAVWWDGENNQLLYSYNLTPNSIAVGQYKQADTKWTTPVPIFGSNIGEYCKIAVIKETNNNYSVHIVGYDGLDCDVWYAYIPNFSNPSGKKTCLVDSYGLIGTELNIDVALDASGNPIPYISYYAGSCAHPKTAHWAGTTSIANATNTSLIGVDDSECFTGVWEVSVIPTQSRVSLDHVNVGVWKDASGTITWSTTDGEAPGESNIGETKLDYKEVFKSEDMGYKQGNTGYRTGGHVWGNGSKNPILGYAITKGAGGFIETAQMK